MRFKEFSKRTVDEAIPAVMPRDMKSVGPGVIQATKNLSQQIMGKLAAAAGTAKPGAAQQAPPEAGTPVSPGPTTQLTPTAIQQAQAAAATKATKLPDIPAIGSQLVLPDKDTKKPASFTIKSMRGNDVDLTPVGSKPTDPKIDVTVKKPDLQRALSALQGTAK
jgi:hypothetical protein